MSFASEVKGEICAITYDDVCCMRAELVGMVCFGAAIRQDVLRLRTEHAIVAQRFYDLVKQLYHVEVPVAQGEGHSYTAQLSGENVLKLLRDMKLASVPLRIHRDIVRRECCRMALVRGAFLGGGSMVDPARGYHAEMATTHFALCDDFLQVLSYFDVFPKRLSRNGTYVFYLKDSEQIENLMAVLGAHGKMMEFLNVKIEKDVRNKTNRLANCDIANVQKTVSAAMAQRAAIQRLQTTAGLSSLPAELQAVASARLDYPDAPLSELAALLGLSKSGVNHRMRKLMELAKEG